MTGLVSALEAARPPLLAAIDGRPLPPNRFGWSTAAEAFRAWWRTGVDGFHHGTRIDGAGLSNRAYHLSPGISSSGLRGMATIGHYLAKVRGAGQEWSGALAIGAAVDDALLTPERFKRCYGEWPVFDRLTDAVKTQVATRYPGALLVYGSNPAHPSTYQAAGDGGPDPVTLFTQPIRDYVITCRDAVLRNPAVKRMRLFNNPEVATQENLWGRDPETGILIRCRLDIVPPTTHLQDFKTSLDAEEEAFRRQVLYGGLHVQAGHHSLAFEWATGEPPASFAWIVLDKALVTAGRGPESVAFRNIEPELIEEGKQIVRDRLRRFAGWLDSVEAIGNEKTWAGYPLDYVTVTRRARTGGSEQ